MQAPGRGLRLAGTRDLPIRATLSILNWNWKAAPPIPITVLYPRQPSLKKNNDGNPIFPYSWWLLKGIEEQWDATKSSPRVSPLL